MFTIFPTLAANGVTILFYYSCRCIIYKHHTTNWYYKSQDNNPKKGLSSGSLFKTRKEALLKYETLMTQARSRAFSCHDLDERSIQTHFPISGDTQILTTKKISTISKQSHPKMNQIQKKDEKIKTSTSIKLTNPEIDMVELSMPSHFIKCYQLENKLVGKKFNHTYFTKIWGDFGPELQLCWIETHQI